MTYSGWNIFKYPPKAVLKTIYGFVLPGIVLLGGAFARAAVDTTKPVNKYDVIAALVAMFVTGGAVFGATNAPQEPHDAEGNDPYNPEDGYAGVGLVLLIVGVLLVALAVLALLKILAISLAWAILLAIAGILLIVFSRRA